MSAHVDTRRYGPTAFGDDARRFWNLTYTLAATDFKLRYFGSALGYLWTLMRPLMFFGVLDFAFTRVFHASSGVSHYSVYLLTSIILWTFFMETTTNAVQSLVAREGLLRKMRFPRLVIPLAVALTALFNLGMNFIAVIIFALASGVYPKVTWLEMPVLVLLLAMLGVGLGMLLSTLFVRFRDIQPIWEVVAQILFYGSPVIYVASQYHNLIRIGLCNPIAAILTQMRHAVIGDSGPVRAGVPVLRAYSAARYIGGSTRLLIPLGIIVCVFALGLWFFNREAPRIAENI